MKILYTPAGDTDPIRGFRDGAILHIIRHYSPDKVVIFLSAEMIEKEEERKIFTKAIQHLAPECEIEIIKENIVDAHHIDKLMPLAEAFLKIRRANANAEILLNLSSGTPQMKTIMSFLATDFENVRGIQVDSPTGKSNRSNFANQDNEDIDLIIEMNEDNEEGAPNRCSEPPLKMLKRYSLRHQMISLLDNYEYASALKMYQQNKDMFFEITGKLLNHAVNREMLKTKEALACIDKIGKSSLQVSKNKEVQELNEFFMVMELRQKKKQLPEFIVKITPFLYYLTKFYFVNKLGIRLEQIGETARNKSVKISCEKMRSNYPNLLDALQNKYYNFRDGTDLAFSNLVIMLEAVTNCNGELLTLLKELRVVEEKQRNYVAHTIIAISENDLMNIEPKLNSAQILEKLRKAFSLVMDGEEYFKKNIYDELNFHIKKTLEDFKL